MIQHHPDPDTLSDYAGGKLNHGAMLVVACHLENCALCRQEISVWECAGGALLEEAEPVALSADALDQMMARLEASEKPKQTVPGFLSRFDIPQALAARKIGRRYFVTPSIWFAPVAADTGEACTYLVYAKAGTVLAQHNHRGKEVTQVIAGAFSDGTGTYGVGDFALTDDTHTHSPTVTQDGECLCLISAEAPMRLTSFPARVLQAMTGHQY